MSRLDEIETFVAIARAGSVTAGARRLGLGKSAASRRLADLEARLGAPLFHRTTRRLSLTEAGAGLLDRAEAILADLADAEAEAAAAHGGLSGRLRIAAPLSFGVAHLTPAVSRFLREHPAMRVEIAYADARADLVGGGFDLAVRIGDLPDSTLVARRLCSIRALPAAAPSFWDAHGRPERPEDLADLPALAYSGAAQPGRLDWIAPDGRSGAVSLRARVFADNGDALVRLAVDGHGFAVEPTFISGDALRDGRLEPVLADHRWKQAGLHAVFPPGRARSARARAFAAILAEAFAAAPPWDRGLPGADPADYPS